MNKDRENIVLQNHNDDRSTIYEGSQGKEEFIVRELWTARQNFDKLQVKNAALQAEVEAQNMAIAQLEHEKNVLEARQAGTSTGHKEALEIITNARQKVADLQEAYTSQSQRLAEEEQERTMLANRVKELEAGIAEDEADLEMAVHEMDREMKAMEERALAAESALAREKVLLNQRLAMQALESADLEFERKQWISNVNAQAASKVSSTNPFDTNPSHPIGASSASSQALSPAPSDQLLPTSPPLVSKATSLTDLPRNGTETETLRGRVTELEELLKNSHLEMLDVRDRCRVAEARVNNLAGNRDALNTSSAANTSARPAVNSASQPAGFAGPSGQMRAGQVPVTQGVGKKVIEGGKFKTMFAEIQRRHGLLVAKEQAGMAAIRLTAKARTVAAQREWTLRNNNCPPSGPKPAFETAVIPYGAPKGINHPPCSPYSATKGVTCPSYGGAKGFNNAPASFTDHQRLDFDVDLSEAVAAAAVSAVGGQTALPEPSPATEALFESMSPPMRPYSEQSLEALKTELFRRGVKDMTVLKGCREDLIKRLKDMSFVPKTSPPTSGRSSARSSLGKAPLCPFDD
mmetsp:Transcript_35781/g.60285  ORF Transcript_35781/g.60285 Transcript_35781/m.60285 type:complete len:577 (-) Transcript_35781:354-2084(-)